MYVFVTNMVYITMQDALLHMYVLCKYSVKNKSPKSLQVVQAQSVCVCVCVCVCVVCMCCVCVCVCVYDRNEVQQEKVGKLYNTLLDQWVMRESRKNILTRIVMRPRRGRRRQPSDTS